MTFSSPDDYSPNLEDGEVLQKKQSIDIDAMADRKVVFDGGRKVYEWKQSLRKVVIYIEAPPSFVYEPPESDIIVKISPYRLRVGLKGSQSYMIDEETFGEVKVRKSDWYIDGGTITVVLAKKVRGHEWERALGGREKRRTSNSQRGSLEGVISDDDDYEETKDLIKKAYKKILKLDKVKKDTDGQGRSDTHDYEKLTDSTHNFLHICPVNSVPFLFALGIAVLSSLCLVLALMNRLSLSVAGNRLVVPAGVTTSVKVAQYCGILVGVLVEEETPTGILFLRSVSRKSFEGANLPPHAYTRFVIVCAFRILLGYLFLFNLFITLVQADNVITIFFDVLALEFVQTLDDNAFVLSQKDILGNRLRDAAEFSAGLELTKKCEMTKDDDSQHRCAIDINKNQGNESQYQDYASAHNKKDRIHFLLRAVYSLNIIFLIAGVTAIGFLQDKGKFLCPTFTVAFGSDFWDEPYVRNESHPQVLMYSYFNGVYQMTDRLKGNRYPVYMELNKNLPPQEFKEKKSGRFLYCKDIQSWVFAHDSITKFDDTEAKFDDISSSSSKSLCENWLVRSAKTTTFDITQIQGDWSYWTGVVTSGRQVSIQCNECQTSKDKVNNDASDCNYHGQCVKKACKCNPTYQGTHCEFSEPCEVLLEPFKDKPAWKKLRNKTSYGRPIYRREIDPKNDMEYLLAFYSGSQWFITWESGEIDDSYGSEYHAFWDFVYDNKTNYVSAFTNDFTPIGVEFMRWASPHWVSESVSVEDCMYGGKVDDDSVQRTGSPWGLLVPIMDVEGQGYFRCAKQYVEGISLNGTDWSTSLGNNPVFEDDDSSPTPAPSLA